MRQEDYFPTLKELLIVKKHQFNDEMCLDLLWSRLKHSGFTCPDCGRTLDKSYKSASRPSSYACACGRHIHPKAGTIFHKSTTPLDKWFHAIYLIFESNGLVPALELQRQLDVTYKTAWRMKNQICKYLSLQKRYSYDFSSVPRPIPPRRISRKQIST